jgi:PAS domain S-box-containing protein
MTRHQTLVVDNSPVILKIVSSILDQYDCEVRQAKDGLEAFDLLGEYKPDIIFTDLIMPKIDGAKLCYLIRNTEELQHIFLVVLSGIAIEEEVKLCALNADMCIVKGSAVTMKENIHIAIDRYERGQRGDGTIYGMEGLVPREVTSELLSNTYHKKIILEQMNEGVVELDQRGRVVMVNRAALTALELAEEKLLTTLFSSHFTTREAQNIQNWINSLGAGTLESLTYDYGLPLVYKDRLFTLCLVPIREGGEIFVTGLLSDITEKKQAEERERRLEIELQRIQRLEAMSVMASGISHDFNNLLTIINGNLELTRLHLDDMVTVERLLDESDQAIGHAMELIRRFSTFSDTCLPRKVEVRLGRLMRDLVDRFIEDSGIDVLLDSQATLWKVDVDSGQIIQMVTNILQNCVEAIGDKEGRVELRLENVSVEEGEHVPPLSFSPPIAGRYVRISIADNGYGITPEVIEHAFDPYFSTKQKGVQKGMGLGLTIVHSIVKKHSGQIAITQREKGGTRVTILLPARPEESEKKRQRPLHLLFRDDDEMMRTVGEKMLQHLHCRVDVAENGEQALEMLLAMNRQNQCYDGILLDLQVDNGMGGLETAQQIQVRGLEVPLVVTSGDGSHEVMSDPKAHGFIASIQKPFSMDMLQEVIDTLQGE